MKLGVPMQSLFHNQYQYLNDQVNIINLISYTPWSVRTRYDCYQEHRIDNTVNSKTLLAKGQSAFYGDDCLIHLNCINFPCFSLPDGLKIILLDSRTCVLILPKVNWDKVACHTVARGNIIYCSRQKDTKMNLNLCLGVFLLFFSVGSLVLI